MPLEDGEGSSGLGVPQPRCPSALAVATRRPSGLNDPEKTGSVCPFRTASVLSGAASHSRAVWSLLAVATRRPSGLKATE